MHTLKPYFFLILFVTLAHYCWGQKDCTYQIDTAEVLADRNLKCIVDLISRDNFKEYDKVKKLPKPVLSQFVCLTNGFSIADKGKPYQDNCSPDKDLPIRQLDYLAVGKNTIILTYWTGGDGVELNIILLEYSQKGIKQLWKSSSLDSLNSPTDVAKMYQEKTLFQTGILRM